MSDVIDYLDDSQTTEEKIRNRMMVNVTDGVDKSEGGYIWDSISPVAIEMVFIAMMAKKVLALGFVQTTSGEYLDMRAEEHGVFRKSAVAATGQIKITGAAGKMIYSGLQVSTEADSYSNIAAVQFATTADVTIGPDGTVLAPIKAVTAGGSGNIAANKIVLLLQSNSTVSGVTNPDATVGGTDEENDDDLKTRYLEYVRTPGTSGNIQDYRQWALAVSGVSAVHVIPLWSGPGTVKVIVLGPDKLPATSELVENVKDYIAPDNTGNRQAPIGASVTVESATPVYISVDAVVILDNSSISIAEIKEKFTADLTTYLASIAFSADTVRIARIGGILIDQAGVVDYVELTINGGASNIITTETQVVIAGDVTINAK